MLGVELLELWRAGRVQLPALAHVYAEAALELQEVPHDDADWVALKLELAAVLSAAAGQVREAGVAVGIAVARYAEADRAAGLDFERLRGDESRSQL
ncbi:hypothetical protein [Dactylosporangium matsuzakiense]|uniref:hypothetical protein n=1 Tax=Dactylosporangium matsuzakiense TaxID=53360 RepID=UPI0021C2EE66|nr:hypothetical protein [Dactylosporangium matsuzakiense]UWZ42799.1 hypothetical protein Dmats_35495 [Dactylosporangium matsuzakiense]